MVKKFLYASILTLGLLSIYSSWFITPVLTGGDWWSIYPEQKNLFSFPPLSWDSSYNLGASNIYVLWNVLPLDITVSVLGNYLSFSNIALLTYFVPYLVIGFFSSSRLFAYFFPNLKSYQYISGFLYIANTYILMVVGGGQLLLGVSYACIPLVFLIFVQLLDSLAHVTRITTIMKEKQILSQMILLSLVWALQLLADPRFVYLSVILCVGYFFYMYMLLKKIEGKQLGISICMLFIVPLFIVLLLHAFWIVPLIISKQTSLSQLGSSYSYGDKAISFFSFAKLEDSLALLHPNWPENIFGKVSFFKPEFILVPLLAFSSLFFIRKEKKGYVIIPFLATIGLIGAFLAKGTNDPFGNMYLFLSHYIPGFQLFRDPVKWYPLIAVSYSLLLPFTVASLMAMNIKQRIKTVIVMGLGIYFLVILSPALTGKLSGTFTYHKIPKEYESLKNMLLADTSFSRTLWVPHIQRFGFRSNTHPQISANDFFLLYDNKKLLSHLSQSKTQEYMRKSAIKYVIVPYDSEREIFLEDRRYSDVFYTDIVTGLQKIPGFHFEKSFGKIAVFSIQNSVDHFWSKNNQTKISFVQESTVKYHVHIVGGKKGEQIIFSEEYNPLWKAQVDEIPIQASLYEKRFTSFVLPKDGTYKMLVVFQPQEWVHYGLVVSGTVLGLLLLSLVLLRSKKG